MRSIVTKTLTLGLLGAAALAWSACEPAKQTQYVAGISTQVQVPRDLKTVRVDVTVGGIVTFCQAYRVYDGKVILPRSLGTYPVDVGKVDAPVTISVVGFTEEFDEGNPAMGNCTSVAPKVGSNGIRVLRRSRQPYLKDQTLFLPMGLKFGCWDTDCETGSGNEKTCKAGRCYDASIDPKTLVPFSPDLVDGSGGGCFSASQCLGDAAVPPAVVNPDDCTYAIPNTPSSPPAAVPNPISTPGDGINVEVTFDGGAVSEVLDRDDQEGFFIPDPTKPQQFRLAPGLCDMVKGEGPDPQDPSKTRATPHRVTGVRASAFCRSKVASQPLCQDDQLKRMGLDANGISPKSGVPDKCQARELPPSASVLVILADDTIGNKDLYEDAELKYLDSALKDPAFAKTDVGLAYYPGGDVACPAPGTNPTTILENARAKQQEIFQSLKTHPVRSVANEPPQLAGKLQSVYQFLEGPQFKDYNKRAVLVLGNRAFNANACGTTPFALSSAAQTASSPVDTYALLFTFDPSAAHDKTDPVQVQAITEAQQISAGKVWDARGDVSNKAQAFGALQKITQDLATCVYDVPTSGPTFDTNSTLAYTDQIAVPAKPSVKIAFNAGCTSDTSTASGWNFFTDASGNKRIRVCGDACGQYRNALSAAQQYAALYLQPSQAVPMFWYNNPCSP